MTLTGLANFWEDIAARLGIIHHEIHMKFINMPDVPEHELLMTQIMAAAVHAKQLRDVVIIERWEREAREMPVKSD